MPTFSVTSKKATLRLMATSPLRPNKKTFRGKNGSLSLYIPSAEQTLNPFLTTYHLVELIGKNADVSSASTWLPREMRVLCSNSLNMLITSLTHSHTCKECDGLLWCLLGIFLSWVCFNVSGRPRLSVCVRLSLPVHLLFPHRLFATHIKQPTEFCQYHWLDSPTTSPILSPYLVAPHTQSRMASLCVMTL